MLTPWSNPASHKWNTSSFASTTIGIEIASYNSTTQRYTLKVRLTNPEQLAPSKPQDCRIAWSSNHPQITWATNLEPDIQSYKIWKHSNGSSMIAATVTNYPTFPTQYWTDLDVTKPGKFDPSYEYDYKVKAVDNTGKESLYSNEVSITGYGNQWKTNNKKLDEIPSDYSLSNNYPNPFNPTTTIKYSIKESGLVSLKVFDVLGKEVIDLVNEVKPVGVYETEFNANDLPSGVYICSLRVNDFVSYRKMVLLK